jgi:ankyrin repeat protein
MKRFFIFFAIGFTISIAITVYEKLTYYQPMVKKRIDVTKVGESVELSLKLKKAGCYEVGFGSYEYDLTIFGRENMRNDGEFEIQYLTKDNKLIDKKVESELHGGGAYGRTTYTNAALDIIQVPLKGYKNIKIKLTVLKPETDFNDKGQKFYFYADKSYHPCGKALEEAKERMYVDSVDFDTNETNETLKELSLALKQKDIKKIKQLIPKEFDPDVKLLIDRTPLHYAAHFNDAKTAKYLISLNASLSPIDLKEFTPLYYAIESNSLDIVKLLIENGADLNTSKHTNSISLLHNAACNEYYEMLEYFLQSPRIDNNAIKVDENIYRLIGADTYGRDNWSSGHSESYKIWNHSRCGDDNMNNTKKSITESQKWEQRALKVKALLDKYGVKPNEQNITIIRGSSVQFDPEVRQPTFFERLFN